MSPALSTYDGAAAALSQYFLSGPHLLPMPDGIWIFFKKKKIICKPDLSKEKEGFVFYFRLIPLVRSRSASPVTPSRAQALQPPATQAATGYWASLPGCASLFPPPVRCLRPAHRLGFSHGHQCSKYWQPMKAATREHSHPWLRLHRPRTNSPSQSAAVFHLL